MRKDEGVTDVHSHVVAPMLDDVHSRVQTRAFDALGHLQSEAEYLLEVGSNAAHGYIDAAMIEASRQRLANFGFIPEQLEYSVSGVDGHPADSSASPVPRGHGLQLTIQYPAGQWMVTDRWVGIDVDEHSKIGGAGIRMSEAVAH